MKPQPIRALTILFASILAAVTVSPLVGFLVLYCGALSFNVRPQMGALSPAAGLKLDTILMRAARALGKRLSPVLALSTVMRNQVLTETDKVKVPFYSLEALDSKDFDGSYSFVGADGGPGGYKEVTVDQRKYQGLEFTSKDLRRNSVVDLSRVLELKVEKLAEDVLDDITSLITNGNYGAAVFTGAASTFDRDDVIDIRTACSQANWPMAGRCLTLESAYMGGLAKDLNAVDTVDGDNVRREGSVGRSGGYDLFEHPNMPANGENLVGYATLPFCLLTAFSPIEPAEEVRDNMSDYRLYTDPMTGLTLEYRSWGDPNSDTARRIIEVNYGKGLGDTAQLKRLVSA